MHFLKIANLLISKKMHRISGEVLFFKKIKAKTHEAGDKIAKHEKSIT